MFCGLFSAVKEQQLLKNFPARLAHIIFHTLPFLEVGAQILYFSPYPFLCGGATIMVHDAFLNNLGITFENFLLG